MSGSAKRPARRPGTVTRGPQTSGEYGTSIEAVGERAIVHHFGCSRRELLRSALVPGAVRFLCPECRAEVSLGPDGQPVGPKLPAAEPMPTPPSRRGGPIPSADSRARIVDEAIAGREPDGTWPTQSAVATALELTDRRIRQIQGPAGWSGIIADAEAAIAGR
jgi:hypothetical protein